MNPSTYTVAKISGLWEVHHNGARVRTFVTEPVARLHAEKWNAGTNPTDAEIAGAINRLSRRSPLQGEGGSLVTS